MNKHFWQKKLFYELIVLGPLAIMGLLWIIGAMCQGFRGGQFHLFYAECNNFLADFTNVAGYAYNRDPYHAGVSFGLEERAYLPLTYFIAFFFSRITDMETYIERNDFSGLYQDPKFMVMFLLAFALLMIALYEILKKTKNGNFPMQLLAVVAVFLSAPFLYSVERGNYILLALFCLFFFLFYYDHENPVISEIALIMLAITAGLKITPALFGLVLIRDKKFKEAIRAVIYGVLVAVLPFLFFKGGLGNIPQFFTNVGKNLEKYAVYEGTHFVSDVCSVFFKHLVYTKELRILGIGIGVLVLAGFFFARKKWQQWLALTIILLMVANHSEYYNIILLWPAIFAFVNEEEHPWWDLLAIPGFVAVMLTVSTVVVRNYCYHLGLLYLFLFSLGLGIYEGIRFWKGRKIEKT